MTRSDRSNAIARKTILLAESKTRDGKIRHPNHCRLGEAASLSSLSPPTTTKSHRRTICIDPSLIAFYVLRDLFISQPSYEIVDLWTKWSTRLPFGEDYERIVQVEEGTISGSNVTMEWLQTHKIVPDQLMIVDHQDNGIANGGTANTSTVIQLTTKGKVLLWHDSA